MPLDAAVQDMIAKIGDSCDWNRDLDTRIQGSCVPTVSTSAAAPCDSNPLSIDLRSREQVVDGSDARPSLNARRGVAFADPIPTSEFVRAMMFTLEFPKLDRIDNQASDSVSRKPDSVVLVTRLVPARRPNSSTLA